MPAVVYPVIVCLAFAVGGLLAWAWRLRRALREAPVPVEPTFTAEQAAEWRQSVREGEAQAEHLRLQLRETQRELASLSYSVSHDMRAPLRSIDGFSQALVEDYGGCLDATAHDYLRRVRSGAAQMNLLIDDLLSLSRIVRAPFQPETVDLSALVQAAARELSAAEPMRQMHWDVQPGVTACGDRALLDVALRHLLVNAWKFTVERPAPRVSFRRLDAPGPGWPAGVPVYEVSDNGVGFDMQYAGKLFGAFQKMHPAEDFPSGRGIGLATVQRIVARHGGTVRADATPQQGTALSFTLSAAPVVPMTLAEATPVQTSGLPIPVRDASVPRRPSKAL